MCRGYVIIELVSPKDAVFWKSKNTSGLIRNTYTRFHICFMCSSYCCSHNMYMYNCYFFVCFRTYLFVRALLAKILNLRRYRKPVRNLRSRFELDPSTVAPRGGRPKFFFFREWIRRFPGVSVKRFFIFIAHTIFFFCGEIMTQRQQQQ